MCLRHDRPVLLVGDTDVLLRLTGDIEITMQIGSQSPSGHLVVSHLKHLRVCVGLWRDWKWPLARYWYFQ